jgi:hypothetical protein
MSLFMFFQQLNCVRLCTIINISESRVVSPAFDVRFYHRVTRCRHVDRRRAINERLFPIEMRRQRRQKTTSEMLFVFIDVV